MNDSHAPHRSRLFWKSSGLLFAVLGVTSLFSQPSRAGSGTVKVDKSNGYLELTAKVYSGSPRSAGALEKVRQELIAMNRAICDESEGRVRFSKLTVTNNPADKSLAEVWWQSNAGRSHAGGSFGKGRKGECNGNSPPGLGGHVVLYDCMGGLGQACSPYTDSSGKLVESNFSGWVLSHEFGHHIFGLPDYYPNAELGDGDAYSSGGFFGANSFQEPWTKNLFFKSLPGSALGQIESKLFPTAGNTPKKLGGDAVYDHSSGIEWWRQNNTIMQQVGGRVCRSAANQYRSLYDFNPVLFPGSPGCSTDADCAWLTQVEVQPGKLVDFTECGEASSSELSVLGNYAQMRWDRTWGDDAVNSQETTIVRDAKHFVVQGFLAPGIVTYVDKQTATCEPGTPNGTENAEFECARTDSVMGSSVACPMGTSAESPDGASLIATCRSCMRVSTNCQPPMGASLCGNGVVDYETNSTPDIGEECDSGNGTPGSVDPAKPFINPKTGKAMRCSELYSQWRDDAGLPSAPESNRISGGVVRCQSNCLFDLTECAYPLLEELDDGEDDILQLAELRDQSTAWAMNLVIDSNGQVGKHNLGIDWSYGGFQTDFGSTGPSAHGLYVFLRRTYRFLPQGSVPRDAADPTRRELWEATFAVDDVEFGGTPGRAHIVRKLNLEFEYEFNALKSDLKLINGVAFDQGEDDPSKWPQLFLGYINSKQDAFGTQKGTGQLVRGAGAQIQLSLDLRSLLIGIVKNPLHSADASQPSYLNKLDKAVVPTDDIWKQTGLFGVYARHGLISVGNQIHEVPQSGDVRYRIANGPNCDAACQKRAKFIEHFGFNPDTQRYETPRGLMDAMLGRYIEAGEKESDVSTDVSKLNEWQVFQDTMCARYGVSWPAPPKTAKAISADPPGADVCPDPEIELPEPVPFQEKTQIVLVLDRSGSMGTEDVADADWKPVSRLTFAKFAAQDLLHDITASIAHTRETSPDALSPKVGLVWFNDTPEAKFPLPLTKACTKEDAATVCTDTANFEFGQCVAGVCKKAMPRIENYSFSANRGNEVTVDLLSNSSLQTPGVSGENPVADGMTGTGAAILKAAELFDPGKGQKRIVVLLTDGIHNRPTGGKCADGSDFRDVPECYPNTAATEDYEKAIETLREKDITVYTFPVEVSGEMSAQAVQNGDVTGSVFPVDWPLAEDSIPRMLESFAEMHGQQLARSPYTPPYIRGSYYSEPVYYDIPVEVGAKSLNVSVSRRDGAEQKNRFHPLLYALVSPSGKEYRRIPGIPEDDEEITDVSLRLRVKNPEAGVWTVKDFTWGGVEIANRYDRTFVAAHVENASPGCAVRAASAVTDGSRSMRLEAEALYDRPIATGVSITGFLQLPDKTLRNLAFTRDMRNPDSGRYISEVPTTLLTMAGDYLVDVDCKVDKDAGFVVGEVPPGTTSPDPSLDAKSPGFTRSARANFEVRNGSLRPVPGYYGNNQSPEVLSARGLPVSFSPVQRHVVDADSDGIPNVDEPPPSVDSDGDGRPDAYDADANANEVPDYIDTAILYSPAAVGDGRTCTLRNATSCCTNIGTCVGVTKVTALYADGVLDVHDGVNVSSNSGTPYSLNAGSSWSKLGVAAKTGPVSSVASVDLRDRAFVSGQVITSGDVLLGVDAKATQGAFEHKPLALRHLSEFSVAIPSGGADVNLEPDRTGSIPPGLFRNVTVKSRSDLRLRSGTYYLSSLSLEPDSRLLLDASAGPIRIFVGTSLKYQGTISYVAGSAADLLLGYMGSSTVVIERAFLGTLVAPRAEVHLASLNGQGSYLGGFFAKNLVIHQYNRIVALPFEHAWADAPLVTPESCSDGIKNQNEVDTDCGGVCGACTTATTCSESTAVDLGADGHDVTVSNDGCLRIRDSYPSWWGTRSVQLQSTSGGTYPVPFSWSNACSGSSGTGTYTGDWQGLVFGPTSSSCATLIDLKGSGQGSVTLRYYAQ